MALNPENVLRWHNSWRCREIFLFHKETLAGGAALWNVTLSQTQQGLFHSEFFSHLVFIPGENAWQWTAMQYTC